VPAGRPKSRSGQYERITLEVARDALAFIDKQPVSRREYIELLVRREMRSNMKDILENYLASDDFKDGVISSTRASWGGSGYSVELLPSGKWFNVWNNQIGNLYESEGVILRLPTLDTDDMSEYVDGGAGTEDDFLAEAFENEREELTQLVRDTLADKE
jgi:hypothetical protein